MLDFDFMLVFKKHGVVFTCLIYSYLVQRSDKKNKKTNWPSLKRFAHRCYLTSQFLSLKTKTGVWCNVHLCSRWYLSIILLIDIFRCDLSNMATGRTYSMNRPFTVTAFSENIWFSQLVLVNIPAVLMKSCIIMRVNGLFFLKASESFYSYLPVTFSPAHLSLKHNLQAS